MPEHFHHGVELVEIDSGPRPIRTLKSSVIGLVGTAPDAEADAFPTDTPILIAGRASEAKGLGSAGTLPQALEGIFDQGGASVVVVRTAGDSVADVIGNATDDTGLHALIGAETAVKVKPRILIAPGFTQEKAVTDKLLAVAKRLKSIVVADGPNTTDIEAITYREGFDDRRLYIVDPALRAWDSQADAIGFQPASSRVAGLIAANDHDRGFWWSPSNQVINGALGTGRGIDFSLDDPESRANLLNGKEVATVIHDNGYRLWGNRTASADPKWAFLNVVRTADIIHDSLVRAHRWAVDRNITRNYFEDVAEGVNAYLATLTSLGAILGGRCWPDPELNTPTNLKAGKVYFNLEFTPPAPAEHVIFRSHMTDTYYGRLVA